MTESPISAAGGSAAMVLCGLSRLSVRWLRLGIQIERITPGHPEQSGRHERMHLTLKQATTKPPGANLLQQQAKFEEFVQYDIGYFDREACRFEPVENPFGPKVLTMCPVNTENAWSG